MLNSQWRSTKYSSSLFLVQFVSYVSKVVGWFYQPTRLTPRASHETPPLYLTDCRFILNLSDREPSTEPSPKRPYGGLEPIRLGYGAPPHRFTKINVMSFPWRHSYWQLLAWHWRSFRASFYRNSSRPPHVSVINRLRTTPLPATAVHSVDLCSKIHFTSSGWFSKKLQMFNKVTCLKEMFLAVYLQHEQNRVYFCKDF